MAAATRESREMRIKQLHPDTQLMQVWKNLHTAWVSEEIASMWYIVVHDIVPTNQRLNVIRLVDSDRCKHCGRRDTLVHRLTECNGGTAFWLWTIRRHHHRRDHHHHHHHLANMDFGQLLNSFGLTRLEDKIYSSTPFF